MVKITFCDKSDDSNQNYLFNDDHLFNDDYDDFSSCEVKKTIIEKSILENVNLKFAHVECYLGNECLEPSSENEFLLYRVDGKQRRKHLDDNFNLDMIFEVNL